MDMWFHSLNNKGYPATILQKDTRIFCIIFRDCSHKFSKLHEYNGWNADMKFFHALYRFTFKDIRLISYSQQHADMPLKTLMYVLVYCCIALVSYFSNHLFWYAEKRDVNQVNSLVSCCGNVEIWNLMHIIHNKRFLCNNTDSDLYFK